MPRIKTECTICKKSMYVPMEQFFCECKEDKDQLAMIKKGISPSRKYVVIKSKFGGGVRPFVFTLPTTNSHIENNRDYAAWYFLNHIEAFETVEYCMTYEEFIDVEVKVNP